METEAAAESESALREQAEKYLSLFNSIDAGFCIVELQFDADGHAIDYRFLEVNPAFERQTGLTNAEGQWMRSLAPDHEQHWFDIYGAVALTGTPIRFERPAEALQNRWFEVYAFRISEPSKRQVAILFTDVSERQQSAVALERANKELRQLSEELRSSNDELEQFTRVAGHDLRAPLSNIIQFSQLLAKRSPDPETEELLNQIIVSGRRMAQLMDDLLRYALFSRAPLAPAVPARADSACSQAKENLRLAIEESEATVDCRVPGDAIVRLELSMLTLVFQNLISNAVNYRRDQVKPSIQISAERENQFWRFAVEDNGEGIDSRDTQQIFEPFKRLHGQERSGSGLGLATCRRIVERSDGRIWVESRPLEGSTFYFSLPKA